MNRLKVFTVVWCMVLLGFVLARLASSVPAIAPSERSTAAGQSLNADASPLDYEVDSAILEDRLAAHFADAFTSDSLILAGRDPQRRDQQCFLHSVGFAAKINCTQAMLFLIEGRREEALNLIAATHRLTQLILNDEQLVPVTQLAVAARGITLQALEIYIQNAAETTLECRRIQTALDELAKSETNFDDLPLNWILQTDDSSAASLQPVLPDSIHVRYQAAAAKFQLLRLALAVQHHRAATGEFPESLEDCRAFFDGDLPEDPMLRIAFHHRRTESEFVIYGLGPDLTDNAAEVEFDVKQGSHAAGDISVRLAAERPYPFPVRHQPIRTQEQLSRQFPNGLPPDFFALNLNGALRMTGGSELSVVSCGPNLFYGNRAETEVSTPSPMFYDPTNGLFSRGSLGLSSQLIVSR